MTPRLEQLAVILGSILVGMCAYSILEREPPNPRIAEIENYPIASTEHRYVWSQGPCKFYDNGDEICPLVKNYR